MTESLEKTNARRFVWANGLQNIGDQIVSPKSVLPWLFTAAGVPGPMAALLVPLRESGSMLPQAAITPWILARASRVRVWVLGALGQAAGAAAIAAAALTLRGPALGLVVLVALAVLALARSVCSITSKDVQGATIPKGRRGRVTGRATELGGAVAVVAGLGLGALGPDMPVWVVAALAAVAAVGWAAAGRVFSGVREPAAERTASAEPGAAAVDWGFLPHCLRMFARRRDFRAFVIVRSLMLVTALSTTFIVTLAAAAGTSPAGLGWFMLASGVAAVVGGRVSGALSDTSSRVVMAVGSAVASLILLLLVAVDALAGDAALAWAAPAAFFAVNLAHTGVRVARKTYVVDMAAGQTRTRYVAAANTLMGLALLAVGAVSAAVAALGPAASLVFLAAVGLVGTVGAWRLPEVSRQG